MGFFRKAGSAVNELDVATDLTVKLSPSIRRVSKLEAHGTSANGVITGIHFTLNDSMTRKEFAVSVNLNGEWQRFGVRTQPAEGHRLRLGVPVVVKVDGSRAILDWDAMAAAWGLQGQFLSQDSMRKPPADGVVDTALDARVQRHLKKWTPTQATIVALERTSVLGLQTLNWNIQLQLPDGTTALSKRDEVPSYAQWYSAPGEVVPAVIDPKDSSRANIDWPGHAIERFDTVGFDDDPPAGSIAAQIEDARTTSTGAPTMSTSPQAVVADPTAPIVLDGTMQGWVDAFRGGYMKAKDFSQTLDDWRAAGMCTQAQADAARAAAGVD